MPDNICIQQGDLCFTVNYWTELLGVISILCQDQEAVCDAGVVWGNEAYHQEVLSHFAAFLGCQATKWLERFSDDYNFNYDAPVSLMLHLGHDAPIDREELCRHRKPIPPEEFDQFIALIRQFEKDSDFAAFYENHKLFYAQTLSHYMADYTAYAPLQFLQDYLKTPSGCRYHINLMLGITNSNYGVTVDDKLYACCCPNGRSRFAPLPDYTGKSLYWTTLIVHEFAHAFINPVTRQYADQIAAINLGPYREVLKTLCYGEDLETYINETVIRAIECLYVMQFFPDQHDDYLQEYVEEGYRHIPQVEQLLLHSDRPLAESYSHIIACF